MDDEDIERIWQQRLDWALSEIEGGALPPDVAARVQAAIAAEPKPVRVPRERAPVVVLDERPLVLVETRVDLRNITLPFENTQPL